MLDFQITPLNRDLSAALRSKIDQKTKPLGALGELESIAHQIGLIQSTLSPKILSPHLVVFAADHGIAAEGVSPYPQAVTAQMVHNFVAGGAAINVYANLNGWQLSIVDAGVNAEFDDVPNLISAKVAKGTKNMLCQAAMTETECKQAMLAGAEIVRSLVNEGCNTFAFGEMGIANTSSASCLMSIFGGFPIEVCVGRGTGLDDTGLERKKQLLSQVLQRHALDASDDPLRILAAVGGFEIAMMVGAMLTAAENKCLIVLDGFITTAALICAKAINMNIQDYCVFAHCSGEHGHRKLLEHLHAKPLLDLGLRLGEGTGAALALPLLQAAVNFLNEMASFESAGVSQKC
jgi:nicotinate-nucleotide--dimethylbenzimidazole phosphoribosyltransferase